MTSSKDRLPASDFAGVTAEFIWQAVQDLLAGAPIEPFGPSTDYDLIADDDVRLPPKAVFGHAARHALNRDIGPKHFSGDDASLCFRLLRAADYQIVPKGALAPETNEGEQEGFEEGRRILRSHIARERAAGLAKAKKAQFVRIHGRLACESCKMVPTTHYGTSLADSCIEVHHKRTLVSEMTPGHRTRLEDLECLCANCHRLEHRRIREDKKSPEQNAKAA